MAARLQGGKWTKKTGSSGDYESPSPEADDAREGRNAEALTGAFTAMRIWFYTDCKCC
jgi:hypothetical protein